MSRVLQTQGQMQTHLAKDGTTLQPKFHHCVEAVLLGASGRNFANERGVRDEAGLRIEIVLPTS